MAVDTVMMGKVWVPRTTVAGWPERKGGARGYLRTKLTTHSFELDTSRGIEEH